MILIINYEQYNLALISLNCYRYGRFGLGRLYLLLGIC